MLSRLSFPSIPAIPSVPTLPPRPGAILRGLCRGVAGLGLGLALLGGPVAAQEGVPGILLELYTSQGCSACPPADAMMLDLAGRDDVIALALHVDYWDYIGWEDTFANPAFTARQKAYAQAQGARHVYTPQVIVGGKGVIVGAKAMKIADQIMAQRAAGAPLAVTARRDGDLLAINVPAVARPAPEGFVVDVVRYRAHAKVRITRGENAGRTLEHANVVTDWARAATWSGREPLTLTLTVPGAEPVVVIVQQAGPGPVMAAVRIE